LDQIQQDTLFPEARELASSCTYFKTFYQSDGHLTVFCRNGSFAIYSKEGVHQGEPSFLQLFSIGLHPILAKIANSIPNYFSFAYADNSYFVLRLSQVSALLNVFNAEMSAIGLSLNLSESAVYIPPWVGRLFSINSPYLQFRGDKVVLPLSTGLSIPVPNDGITVLGAPFGTASYCQQVYQSKVTKSTLIWL